MGRQPRYLVGSKHGRLGGAAFASASSSPVAAKLGVRHFVGTGLDPTGRITHFGPNDKPLWTDRLRARLGIPAERVAAVGDSSGDVPLLQAAHHAYFVGKDLPATLGGHATHLPAGDLREIASHILSRLG